MNKLFTERERQIQRHQARRKGAPLAELPNGRMVYEDQLDLTPREQVKLAAAYAVAMLVCLVFIVAMGLAH